MTRVSVIMNCYRVSVRFLEDAIESYKTQAGVDVQLIVSTVVGDEAVQIANSRDCTVVVSERPGIYAQLNNALRVVDGDWFAYAAGDDIAEPHKLAHELAICLEQGADVCYSSFYITDHLLRVRSVFRPPSAEYSRDLHLQSNFVSDCALMSRTLLESCSPFDESVGDHAFWDFWLRARRDHGANFAYNPKPEWYYRQHGEAIHARWTAEDRARRHQDALRMLSRHTASRTP